MRLSRRYLGGKSFIFFSLESFDDIHEGSSTFGNAVIDSGVAKALDALTNYSLAASFGVDISEDERDRLRVESDRLFDEAKK